MRPGGHDVPINFDPNRHFRPAQQLHATSAFLNAAAEADPDQIQTAYSRFISIVSSRDSAPSLLFGLHMGGEEIVSFSELPEGEQRAQRATLMLHALHAVVVWHHDPQKNHTNTNTAAQIVQRTAGAVSALEVDGIGHAYSNLKFAYELQSGSVIRPRSPRPDLQRLGDAFRTLRIAQKTSYLPEAELREWGRTFADKYTAAAHGRLYGSDEYVLQRMRRDYEYAQAISIGALAMYPSRYRWRDR